MLFENSHYCEDRRIAKILLLNQIGIWNQKINCATVKLHFLDPGTPRSLTLESRRRLLLQEYFHDFLLHKELLFCKLYFNLFDVNVNTQSLFRILNVVYDIWKKILGNTKTKGGYSQLNLKCPWTFWTNIICNFNDKILNTVHHYSLVLCVALAKLSLTMPTCSLFVSIDSYSYLLMWKISQDYYNLFKNF